MNRRVCQSVPLLLVALFSACGTLPALRESTDADHGVTSWRESVEAELDVIVFFDDQDWDRVQSDARRNQFAWARRRVIEQLGQYHADPPAYFLSRPPWLAATLSFPRRVDMEILGHVLRNDNQIRFSEYFGTRYMWQP